MNREQLKKLEADLWSAADKLRTNSDLKASEYSTPVLGLIFLRFVDNKYRQSEEAILAEFQRLKDVQTQRQVRSEIERVLDQDLPDSYDRTLFKQKCDNVYDLVTEYASRRRKWAA